MPRITLTRAMIEADELNPWMPVVNAAGEALDLDSPVPLPPLHVHDVVRTDGAMNNGGWALAIDDYATVARRSPKGYRFFGLNKHADVLERALRLYEQLEEVNPEMDGARYEQLCGQLDELDSSYYGLESPTDAIVTSIRANPDRYVFDVEV